VTVAAPAAAGLWNWLEGAVTSTCRSKVRGWKEGLATPRRGPPGLSRLPSPL
jgi:hypothetical protein